MNVQMQRIISNDRFCRLMTVTYCCNKVVFEGYTGWLKKVSNKVLSITL